MREREQSIVFPQIARFPGEPRPEGVPRNPTDSEFSSPEFLQENFGYLALVDYSDQKERGKKKQVVHNLAQKMLKSPEFYSLDSFVEQTDRIRERSMYGADKLGEFEKDVKVALLAQTRNCGVPEVEQIGAFLKVAVGEHQEEEGDSELDIERKKEAAKRSQQYSEAVLERLIDYRRTEKSVVDTLYNICLAAVKSNDPKVELFVARIMAYDTDLFTPDSNQSKRFAAALFSTSDEIIGKVFDIDYASRLLRDTHDPSLTETYERAHVKMSRSFLGGFEVGGKNKRTGEEDPIFVNTVDRGIEHDPERAKQIFIFLEEQTARAQTGEPFSTRTSDEVEKPETFPRDLICQPRELRVLYNQRFAEWILRQPDFEYPDIMQLWMPYGQVKAINVFENRQPEGRVIIRESFKYGDGGSINVPESINTALEYLRPELQNETREELTTYRDSVRTEVFLEPDYDVSPRGEIVKVSDDSLTELGVRAIRFDLDEKSMDTLVTILVKDYQVPLRLDEYYNLRKIKGHNSVSEDAKLWWESVVLSHLRPLLMKRDKSKVEINQKIGSRKGEVGDVDFTDRKAHKRDLASGQVFTVKQRQRVLDDTHGRMDLVKFNAIRGLTAQQYERIMERFKEAGVDIEPFEYERFEPGQERRISTWVLKVDKAKKGGRKKPYEYEMEGIMDEVNDILH